MPGSLPIIEYRDFSLTVHTQAAERGNVVNAQIELTYGCNLHCVHCYTDCYNRPDLIRREMPYEEIVRILDQLAEQGILWVCFTGGENFVRKDFLDIYAYAKQKGFLITLFTNGPLITEKIADTLKEHPPRQGPLNAWLETGRLDPCLPYFRELAAVEKGAAETAKGSGGADPAKPEDPKGTPGRGPSR